MIQNEVPLELRLARLLETNTALKLQIDTAREALLTIANDRTMFPRETAEQALSDIQNYEIHVNPLRFI